MEGDAFLQKAAESVASAADDHSKGRYNSCARSTYYAAFQAAVAALIGEGVRPSRRWEHEFVHSRFAGLLVRRRKIFPSHFAALLVNAFRLRAEADYSANFVGAKRVGRILEDVRELVGLVREETHGDS